MLKKTSLFGLIAAGALAAGVVGFVGCASTMDPNTKGTCAIPSGDNRKPITEACAKLNKDGTTCEADSSASKDANGKAVAGYHVCKYTGPAASAASGTLGTCAPDDTLLNQACVGDAYNTAGTCQGDVGLPVGGDVGYGQCDFTPTPAAK
jgi:hypothetical protein